MAEKIYPASDRKRKKERENGNVMKSADVVTLANLFVTLTFIYLSKDALFDLMEKFLTIFRMNMDKEFNPNVLSEYMKNLTFFILPLVATTAITGFLANYFQIGLKFTLKPLAPDIKKINPINGFKKMFSKDSLVELVKSLLKVAGVLYIAFIEIKKVVLNMNSVYTIDMFNAANYIFNTLYKISTKILLLLVAVGIVDYGYKKFKFEKDLMMTREEMMEEFKQTEGNPQTKNRQKELGRMMSLKQIQKVREATVVVTNPTHFAVAIKYTEGDYAPIVLFKGVDEIALNAKKIASESNVPMIENKPLARALYSKCKEGDYIPEELFESIAEVIRYVYTLNDTKK